MYIKRLHIDVTDNCDLHCLGCHVRSRQGCHSQEEDIDDSNNNTSLLLKIIDGAKEYGIRNFSISGGEPLVHPEIMDILKACCFENSSIILFTNLHFPNKEVLNSILELDNIKSLITSLDGLDGHNISRAPSDHKDILSKIAYVKKKRPDIKVTVNTVVNKYSSPDLFRLHQVLYEHGINHWRVDLPLKTSHGGIYPEFRPMVTSAAKIIAHRYKYPASESMRVSFFKIYKSSLEGMEAGNVDYESLEKEHPCSYNLGQIAIRSDGTITLCSPLRQKFEQFNGQPFIDLVEQYVAHPFFQATCGQKKLCKTCKYFALCMTDCSGDALEWTGDVMGPNPIACSLMPLVEEVIIPILSPGLQEVYRSLIKIDADSPPYLFNSQKEMQEYFGNHVAFIGYSL